MITAKSWIDSGIASDVILLATDLCGVPQVLRGFSDLGAAVLDMPPFEACRPFQEGSRGLRRRRGGGRHGALRQPDRLLRLGARRGA